ncbi:MAG: CYTH domain-containing protein [Thermoleophilaceae bacterium]|nr:CYTH domain-containing protein [Thermoleophilaceae bacterium]
MSAHHEIERKFLVTGAPPDDLDQHPSDEIRQGYLAVADDGTEVRVRARGGDYTLTVKSGPSRTRVEEEIEIDERRFESLWQLTAGRRIEKRRHLVPSGDLSIELDVYAGDLDGLVTAEVEFESADQAEAFDPPPWIGTEVTGDGGYSNQSLAAHGRPRG